MIFSKLNNKILSYTSEYVFLDMIKLLCLRIIIYNYILAENGQVQNSQIDIIKRNRTTFHNNES